MYKRQQERPSSASTQSAAGDNLVDVETFVERLLRVDADKRLVAGKDEQRVFVSAVAGVSSTYPNQPQTFESGPDAEFERVFGIGSGCILEGRVAAPSVRTVEAAEAFEAWQADVVSICAENWTPALACLPGIDPREQMGPFCLDVELLGPDPDLSRSCVLTETRESVRLRLPECTPECSEHGCGPPYAIPDGAEGCVAWQTASAQQHCLASGFGAEAMILRREPSWETLEYEATCAAEI
ncbi:MAG: hypothetical protein KUG77_27915 [Nannocystaceae bacterium]|nr:hypothetical protein [Nannocystaceae bacterium]